MICSLIKKIIFSFLYKLGQQTPVTNLKLLLLFYFFLFFVLASLVFVILHAVLNEIFVFFLDEKLNGKSELIFFKSLNS